MLSLTRRHATAHATSVPTHAATVPTSGSDTGQATGEAPPSGVGLGRHVRAFDGPTQAAETRRGHTRRMARRTRLHGYALVAVLLCAFVIALAAANTAHVKISWLFGTSHVSLLWLILATAIVGWLLGLLTNAALNRRTRAPRPAPRP
jgi:uncharacterized integral membrane protein